MLNSPFVKIDGKVYWIHNGTFIIQSGQIAIFSPGFDTRPIPFTKNEQTHEEKHILDSQR